MGYEAFEKICKTRGVTPYRVAKDTGVTTATLSSWKNGRYIPKTDKLQILADYFGVDVRLFLENEDVQTVEQEEYYYDKETLETAQELARNKELQLLFDAARNIDKEDIIFVCDLIKRMKKTNRDD